MSKTYKLKKEFPAIGGFEKDKEYKDGEFPKAWRHMFEEQKPSPSAKKTVMKENKKINLFKKDEVENKKVSSDSEETDVVNKK